MNNKFLNLLLAFFILMPLVGCAKENTNSLDQNSQASSRSTYQKILEEQKRNAPAPPIDPSICKDNARGYIYFKIGDEIFRYNKNSPIYISLVAADSMRAHRKRDADIPEGCEGNPYLHPGLSIELRHEPKDSDWQKIEFYSFLLREASREEKVYGGQDLVESAVLRLKANGARCTLMDEVIEKCFYINSDEIESFPKTYQARKYLVAGRPYVLDCESYVSSPRCMSAYRLYPSVDFAYSFLLRQNKQWDEKNIIIFDQYIRNSFESIRVSK